MKRSVVLIGFCASLLAYAQSKQPLAEIKGTVTDINGAPVAGATVYAILQDPMLDDATPRSVKSDANGGFRFTKGIALRSYKLYSQKIEDDYPDSRDKFYADSSAATPEVKLTSEHPSANVVVRLGQPAGVVAGRVIDAKTGETIRALLAFGDGEGNGHEISVDGEYRILVPPGKDVTLMVTAIGMRSDRFQIPMAPLRLEAGQHVYIDIPVNR